MPGTFLKPFYSQQQETFLTFLRSIEQEPTLMGASAHLLAVARKA